MKTIEEIRAMDKSCWEPIGQEMTTEKVDRPARPASDDYNGHGGVRKPPERKVVYLPPVTAKTWLGVRGKR